MQQHMHMARVPEGEEESYIRGLMAYHKISKKKKKNLILGLYIGLALLLTLICVSVLYGASYSENVFYNVVNGVTCTVIVCIFWAAITARVRENVYLRKTIKACGLQVCEVEVVDVHGGQSQTPHYVKVRFRDGICSLSYYRADFYSESSYCSGLLVNIYDETNHWIDTILYPICERDTNVYRLAVRGFRELRA